MAISRVPGFSLLSNLDRQGVDLQFTTDSNALVYMDFTNFRFGVNTTTPRQSLEVNGNVLVANGHVLTSANLTYDLGDITNWWRKIYVGDVVAGNLSIGNITISGNTTSGIIYADELYDSNHRVLTTNTTFTLSGDVTGSGMYSNIVVSINNSGVSPGTYGSTDYVPQLIINSKGIVTSAANVVLTRLGNLLVNNTLLYTSSGNITISPADGNISVANARITNLATPISSTDAATKLYVDSSIATAGRAIVSYNSTVEIYDDNISPAWITTVVDGTEVANVTVANTKIYNTVTLGNLTIKGNNVSSTGNIIVETQYPGIVKLYGNTAIQIPAGDDLSRPPNPVEGYIRYSTSRNSIEYWDGAALAWQIPGEFTITSDTITPNGVSNVFILTSNTSTQGVLVNINGTIQQPYTAYTVTNNAIQFTEVPLTTDIIEVRTLAAGAALTVDTLGYSNSLIIADGINLNVTGNILPSANVTYDLGSPTLRWRTGYFSANTIDIGGGTIGLHDVLGFTFTTPGGTPQYMMPNGASTSNTFTSATVTIQGNLAVDGNITAVGNISGQYILGSAQFLTGLPVQYSNVNVKAYTESMGLANYSNVNVAAYITSYTGNVGGTLSNASQPYITALGTISSGTWTAGTIGVAYGGTGATSTSGVGGALDNLLPSGEQTGYVLTTGGSGSYYWAAGSGGGGVTVGQSLTTLRQSNAIVSNTTVIGLAGISYTPGAGQLRVYVNGVRQFPAAYTETSNVSYTLSANVVSGDAVFTEIDAFSSFNNYANLTYASNVGNISASGLTVQSAIESLENNKAPLASPVFSGVTTIGGNLVVQGNLFVNGNLTTINANNLTISDSMIYLADDNPADTLDIGIVSAFTDAVRYQHTGFVRDATDGVWKLFANVVPEPTSTIDFTNANYSNLRLGNLTAIDGSFTGNISATVSGFAIGYRDLPQVTAGNVTLALTDASKHFYANTGAPSIITVPSNANVAFPIGTTIVIVNRGSGNITIQNQGAGAPFLYLSGNATTTTSRTLTQYGMATLVKTETNLWFVNGTGVV